MPMVCFDQRGVPVLFWPRTIRRDAILFFVRGLQLGLLQDSFV